MKTTIQQTSGKPGRVGKLVLIVAILLVGAGGVWKAVERLTDPDPTRAVVLADVIQPGVAAGYNVLLITLDTTRPDHLGCYGFQEAKTPTIDSLVNHGVRFDDAVTSVPITLPSHATMMTGLYPPTMGVRANGTYRLAPEHVTLAEILRDRGYATAAFVSSFVLDKRFGLAQGFDVYDFEVSNEATRHPVHLHNERSADRVTTSAVRWFKSRKDAGGSTPFFAWVHYFDPHAPYASPLAISAQLHGHPYDAEIAFVDLQLKRLLGTIDQLGLRERTLVILATDHGEALFEHDEAYHSVFVYDSTLRVAMILSCPTLFDRPYRVDDRVVALVDLTPSILDLLGLPALEVADGRSLLKRDPLPDRAIYIETFFPRERLACSPLFGLRRHHDKYILAPTEEYYDLRADPKELRNLADYGGEAFDALRSQLAETMARWPDGAEVASRHALSAEDTRKLEALGYVSAPIGSSQDDVPCDPKDHIHTVNQMSEVSHLIVMKRYEEALALNRELAAENEDWMNPIRSMAKIYTVLGQWDKAVQVQKEFVKRHPTSDMLFHLAYGYRQLGDWAMCEETLQAAELLDPQMGAIPLLRGDRLFERGQYEEAIEQYQKALELDAVRVGPDATRKLQIARKRLREGTP